MARERLPQSSQNKHNAREPNRADRREQASDGAPDKAAAPGLHIVATPIGNLGDITVRALDVLAGVDAIACEDTRVTRKLLSRYAITTKTVAYNDHNARRVLPNLMERLNRGDSLALVSDAGTPLISDPGFRLVEAAIADAIPVQSLPGPSAAIAGLVLSGLPTDGFFFAGFPPPRTAARKRRFGELAPIPGSLVFYESPQRLAACLADLHAVLGDRPAAVARELTKLHEEVVRGTLSGLADRYAAAEPPRGEIVLLVGPPPAAEDADDDTVRAALSEALDSLSLRDAVARVTSETGRARRDVYRLALEMTGKDGDG